MTKAKTNLSRELLNRIWAARSVDELELLLAEASEQSSEQPELALAVYSQLRQLTFDDPERAKQHILNGLLDWCCKESSEQGSWSTMRAYESRNLLENWLYQYPFEQHVGIRNALLRKLTESIEKEPLSEKLWTIASIGYRTDRVVEVLDRVLRNANESLADTALSVLAGLGVPPSRFDSLLDIVAKKLQTNQLTTGCIYAIQELPGPKRSEFATEVLRVAETLGESETNFHLAFPVACKVVERSPDNYELHNAIWKVFSRNWRTIQMSPQYANSCDVADTIAVHIAHFLAVGDSGDKEVRAYILLSRLSELIKPNQLTTWRRSLTETLESELKQFATFDTKNEGRYVTTSLHLKQQAWESALVAGVKQVDRWIDAAVLDETDASAAHSVSKIAACIRPSQLSDRFLDSLQTQPEVDDWTRHLGMTELARSCSDRRSFDALLNFGLTKNGNVLLSTVEAITDCALTRIREGDLDIVKTVLSRTVASHEHRHRVAAIDVFCDLVVKGKVSGSELNQLWNFALDKSLDDYSRFSAMQAIGESKVEVSIEQQGKLLEIARNESELGWRSCEALVKRGLLTIEDDWLRIRLRLKRSGIGVELANEEEVGAWRAYVIGLLFRQEPTLFENVMVRMISVSSEAALYQLINSLEHVGRECPKDVAHSLLMRVNRSHNSSRANLELIRVLRIVSPPKLLALAKARDWPNWLPVAKASLCEMVEAIAKDSLEYQNDCISLLFEFVRDASFQVRRSAYRGLANIVPAELYELAIRWSRTGDVELRKRGAEAVTWLPRVEFPDENILNLGYGWDEEPSVRKSFKDFIQSRYRRSLSCQYLDALLRDCWKLNGVLDTYQFARALEQLGDDESARKIDDFLVTQCPLLPHVGHFLEKTTNAIRKNWKKETEKWPEPWSHETGIVETVTGQLLIPGKEPIDAVFTLRCRHRKAPSELGEWSATAVADACFGKIGFDLPDYSVVIRLKNRSEASVQVFDIRWRDNTAVFTLGGGLSEYPSESEALAEVSSIHDQVRDAIKQSGASLAVELTETPSHTIAMLIENAELSFLEMEFPAGLKQVCQVTSVVLASMVRLFNNEPKTSVLLWRIANSILGQHSHILRLAPGESEELQELARQSDPKSPDELLFWLLEKTTRIIDDQLSGFSSD